MTKTCFAVLIVTNPTDPSLAGAKKLVAQLRAKEVSTVHPVPGKPLGWHVEDIDGENIGLSGLAPPPQPDSAFTVDRFLGLRSYNRKGEPDDQDAVWYAVIDVVGSYEHD